MPKLTVNMDKDNGVFEVTVNGKRMENVRALSIYDYGDVGEDSILSVEIDMKPQEDDGYRIYKRVIGKNSEEASNSSKITECEFSDDLVVVNNDDPNISALKSMMSKS